MFSRKSFLIISSLFLSVLISIPAAFGANEMATALTGGTVKHSFSLWQLIADRGWIMVVFGLMSLLGLSLVVYYFLAFSRKKLIPEEFLENLISLIKGGKDDEAKRLCESNSNLIADVAAVAFARRWEGRDVVEQVMNDEGRRNVTFLWQRLSYLVDIATIAPMVGLLGTVVGMIEAFNGIAFEVTAIKPILLASGIAKAMIATAAGLFIAIPAMGFYAYFRGVVQNIITEYDHIATELLYLITSKTSK